jgi:hypothetical protein
LYFYFIEYTDQLKVFTGPNYSSPDYFFHSEYFKLENCEFMPVLEAIKSIKLPTKPQVLNFGATAVLLLPTAQLINTGADFLLLGQSNLDKKPHKYKNKNEEPLLFDLKGFLKEVLTLFPLFFIARRMSAFFKAGFESKNWNLKNAFTPYTWGELKVDSSLALLNGAIGSLGHLAQTLNPQPSPLTRSLIALSELGAKMAGTAVAVNWLSPKPELLGDTIAIIEAEACPCCGVDKRFCFTLWQNLTAVASQFWEFLQHQLSKLFGKHD